MLDLAILVAFVSASVWMGVRSRRLASRNLGEYFLAGRSLRGWQAGASMAATQFAADTPLVVAVLAALLTPQTSMKTLVAFYERARPVGFWAPVAAQAQAGESAPVRALARQLLTTALCAVSLFACMYGCTRLLLPHPNLGRTPAIIALVIGIALAPVWWTRGFKR